MWRIDIKVWSLVGVACLAFRAAIVAAETPTVSNLSARQRYPWNGLVNIERDIAYSDENTDLEVSVVATNTATNAALPVRTLHVADGSDIVTRIVLTVPPDETRFLLY